MEINLNKSTKRALSLVLAFAVAIGSLFTANIGVNIKTDAATEGTVVYWENGGTEAPSAVEGVYIIDSAEKLAYVAQNAGNYSSATLKIADGISVIYLCTEAVAAEIDKCETADAVNTYYSANAGTNLSSSGTFSGTLDGNGATIYGLYSTGANASLFSSAKGATVKNLAIKKSYFNGSTYTATFFGNGSWSVDSTLGYSALITIENCVVEDCYVVGNGAGAFIGNAAYSALSINNCLAADCFIGASAGTSATYPSFAYSSDNTVSSSGTAVPTTVQNCVGVGVIPRAGTPNTTYNKTIVNCYTTYIQNGLYSGNTAVDMVWNLSDSLVKGVSAKMNMTGLDWAVDGDTANGKWYVLDGDYPTPIYPGTAWQDIAIPDVWDGSAADAFAGGDGSKENPYIIKTAAQLYKMVQDGGREVTGTQTLAHIYANTYTRDVDNNYIWEDRYNITVNTYKKCYYKVADGVTDIYLNPVVDGTLDTLKTLVNSNLALNWTKEFNASTYMADADKDGIRDQLTAFRGEFDGNGVTIHGLYSTAGSRTWNIEGVGFVPALMDDAVIKNVNFDKSYIYNKNYSMAAVITTSLGIDDANSVINYDIDENNSGGQTVNSTCYGVTSVGIHNVSVSNAFLKTTSNGYNNTGVAGFVSTYATPSALTLTNCFFDGTNSEFESANTSDLNAGLVSSPLTTDNINLENCVSVGAYPIPVGSTKYMLKDCYTTETTSHTGLTGGITKYSVDTMPALNWTQWSVDENGELAVTGNSAADNHSLNWNEAIANTNESRWSLNDAASSVGNWTITGARDDGTYINYENMQGSGTKDDPYLVSDALTLARVIGSGGMNYTERLYFKLTNDINVGGWRWITTDGYSVTSDGVTTVKYAYVPFAGEIDGDGYAVTGLYVNDDSYAALIPQMTATGIVKNLHIRNSYATGTNAAVITANAASGAVIEGCSVEGATGVTALADETATINNSYSGDTYYVNDAVGTPTLDGTVWYGIEDGKAYLVNRAKAMTCADINGDGIGDEYDVTDLTSLRNKILRKSAYDNIYGDLNLDGKVNTGDLVILNREILAQSADDVKNEWVAKDGFWRNLALDKFAIYYGENDNYDAARKLELYLESAVPGLDVKKNVSGTNVYVHSNDGTEAPSTQLAIVVGNVGSYTTALTGNDYGITYDDENAVLWLQGANFTGVEQAVLDFIAGSDAATGAVYTVESDTLSDKKQPKTVNGVTYYYAWGDEFDVETSDGSVSKDVWEYGEMGTEYKSGANSKYMNMVTANADDLSSLYEVTSDGKLKIWRGLDSTKYDASTHSWGYKPVTHTGDGTTDWGATVDSTDVYASAGVINTQKSLLFKQGYIEMKATLPNDGHSFPAWWLLGAPDGGQNRTYDTSLFGKVYRLNNNWTGVNAMNGAYPNSYKYQIPTCHLEMDIVELMQDISYVKEFNTSWENFWGSGQQPETHITGVDRTKFDLNVHKWYDENVDDNTLYVIDWDENGNGGKIKGTYNYSTFDSTTAGAWTHRWDGLEYDMSSLSNLAGEHTYGFAWTANETANTFTVTVYVDGAQVMTFNQDREYYDADGNASEEQCGGESALNSEGGTVFNQYVYFLLDNHFYSANQEHEDGTTEYIDLPTQEDGDVATFTIDYIRVYQENDKRDIVTPETEAFNNGNHFGY